MSGFRNLSRSQRGMLLAGVVVVATVVLFGAGEIGVRIRHRLKFGSNWGIEDTYTVDPASNLRIPIPGSTFGGIRINSLGFRGPEIKMPKPASAIRIAFLGSSTTYCGNVSNNETTWPHLVTQALQAKWQNVPFDYINAGVPGYGLSHSLQNLKQRVGRLDPDVIVIYEGHNDLSFNSFQLATQQGVAVKRTEETLSWATKYSLLWYLVEKNLMVLRLQNNSENLAGKLHVDIAALDAPFRSELKGLVDASQRVAKLVVLVTFSTQLRAEQAADQQKDAAVTSMYYMPYMSPKGLIEAYRSYNHVVGHVAAETGALLVAGENSIPGDREHFVDSVHFTDKGSRAMADRVAHALIESGRMNDLIPGEISASRH